VWRKNSPHWGHEKLVARTSYLLYALWCIVGGAAITLAFIFKMGYDHTATHVLYVIWGAIASGTIMLQWIPQIYTTWKLKGPGSLSIITLMMNSVGSVLNVYFYVADGNAFWTWFPFVISGYDMASLPPKSHMSHLCHFAVALNSFYYWQ
jgi:hypothetical protein